MKCKYCGAEIANDSVYCEQCGKFTNPFNKRGVTCSMSLVKWLIMGVMTILCLSTPVLGFYYLFFRGWMSPLFWTYPIISLAILVLCLVLTKKKMLSVPFTIVTVFLGATIITDCSVVIYTDTGHISGDWLIIQAGILLLYIIYEIVAVSIARKRIRRG